MFIRSIFYQILVVFPSLTVHYPKTRVILDGSEIKIQAPKSVENRVRAWSKYKSNFTAKFLVGISPCGLIIFMSKAYGGRTTDSQLTTDSGVLEHLESGDIVMCDKGEKF